MNNTETMPATIDYTDRNLYYVGDCCYVLDRDDWDTVCACAVTRYDQETTDPEDFDPEFFLDPEGYTLDDEFSGRPIAVLSTAYGDGCYTGSDGKVYSVDSGTIGCIRVADIVNREKFEDAIARGLGHLHEFPADEWYMSNAFSDEGVLVFYSLEIATA